MFNKHFFLCCAFAASNMSAQAYPVSIVDYNRNIYASISDVDEIKSGGFKNFTEELLERIGGVFGDYKVNSTSLAENNFSGLVIVRVPLVSNRKFPELVSTMDTESIDGACQIQSPWLHVGISHSPTRSISGVIYWNERQILQDILAMGGAEVDELEPPSPFSQSEFIRFANLYANIVINSQADEPENLRSLGIPPELLRLFMDSVQTTFVPFQNEALSSMYKISEQASDKYANLVSSILEECADENAKVITFVDIHDALRSLGLEPW